MSGYVPPVPPYDPTDRQSFSFETVVKRWPVIITNVIDEVYRAEHGLARDGTLNTDAKYEAKGIIEVASKLKYEMGRDRPLERILEDGQPLVKEYNEELYALGSRNTWFTAPWLFAECFLYRLFHSWFASTTLWKDYDPFFAQKCSTFESSKDAVDKLAETFGSLDEQRFQDDPAKIKLAFKEMLQVCLWGNATDLSLLTNMSHEDIQKLQSVEQDERKKFIMKDDTERAWTHVASLRDAQIDIVLDNAGFELYTDMLLADFLVSFTPFFSRVVFHAKAMPWFVSDVTRRDFDWLLGAAPASLTSRWKAHIDSGAFVLAPTEPFWTGPWAFHELPARAPHLLSGSGLALFKGDLNYRKLTGDVKWPTSTPFREALGPMAGFCPVLSLRTNKADVAVGLEDEVVARVEKEDSRWRVNGRYALVSFEPLHPSIAIW